MSIRVDTIPPAQHLEFIEALGEASFLQLPSWGQAKPEWRSESIGFFDGDNLTGVGLVLYRQLPKLKRYLAYLPEGPVLDWERTDVEAHLDALVAHARRRKAFAVRIGPTVVHRRWLAPTVKAAIADEQISVLSEAAPDETTLVGTRVMRMLEHLGWQQQGEGHGFAAGQPKFNYQVRLTDAEGTALDDAALLKGMNQLWRRNIKKAEKLGVTVTRGERADLARFHEIYLETAARDGFTGRGLDYFETMWDALNQETPDRMRVYLAEHEGDLVAATTWIRVGRHAWYSYGASTTAKREVRGSNAIQWQMMRDARDAGATVYDLRGITEGLAADDPEIGLIQFKVGTGGEAVAHVGEWDRPINPLLHFAFQQYLKRR